MVQQDKITVWLNAIQEITGDIEDLMYSKYLIEELEEIIKKNDFVKQSIGSFWEHYKLNYTYFVISKIFHQIDEDSKSLSLINLLQDLLSNHHIITERWWINKNPRVLSPKTFQEYFGKNGELDSSIVREDIEKLTEATSEIKPIRHKRVAHKDKSHKFSYAIKSEIVNKAIKKIEELVIKYQLLLTQAQFDSLTPVPDDWPKVFTVPWIKNES